MSTHEQRVFNQRGSTGCKTKKEAPVAVDCVFLSIANALKKKDTVTLIGFGAFKVAQRKARKGKNPQTGQEMTIKAKKFPGKALKDAIR